MLGAEIVSGQDLKQNSDKSIYRYFFDFTSPLPSNSSDAL